MQNLLTEFLLYFTSFFTLINPLGTMPVFLSMTSGLNERERAQTARKAVIVATITMLAFAFTGQMLFRFFGISIDSLRVVGGILFFAMGYDMLQARITRVKITDSEIEGYVNDISITPLAIPMLCGPGAITNAIVLMEDAHGTTSVLVLVASILVIGVVTLLVLLGASRITKFLGDTGNKVMMRLMGLIVMVIAVEFFLAGIRPFIDSVIVAHFGK